MEILLQYESYTSDDMNENISFSHLVSKLHCKHVGVSMFRAQNHNNCCLSSFNTHCCQPGSLIITNHWPLFTNH